MSLKEKIICSSTIGRMAKWTIKCWQAKFLTWKETNTNGTKDNCRLFAGKGVQQRANRHLADWSQPSIRVCWAEHVQNSIPNASQLDSSGKWLLRSWRLVAQTIFIVSLSLSMQGYSPLFVFLCGLLGSVAWNGKWLGKKKKNRYYPITNVNIEKVYLIIS